MIRKAVSLDRVWTSQRNLRVGEARPTDSVGTPLGLGPSPIYPTSDPGQRYKVPTRRKGVRVSARARWGSRGNYDGWSNPKTGVDDVICPNARYNERKIVVDTQDLVRPSSRFNARPGVSLAAFC